MKNDLIELEEQAADLCCEIERLPAGTQQTNVSVKAAHLLAAIRRYGNGTVTKMEGGKVVAVNIAMGADGKLHATPREQINAAIRQKQKPTVGRSVHFVRRGVPGHDPEVNIHEAAIITRVDSDSGWVCLAVFPPMGSQYQVNSGYDEGCGIGSWHWPERED